MWPVRSMKLFTHQLFVDTQAENLITGLLPGFCVPAVNTVHDQAGIGFGRNLSRIELQKFGVPDKQEQ